MSFASYEIAKLEAEVAELREKNTILKAERDEANRTRDEMQQLLLNILARIHRDGGQYTDTYGITASVVMADTLVATMLRIIDSRQASNGN
jgi:hypothetical protein